MFRLCLAVGAKHPDHLHGMLSRRQLREWGEYAMLEPFGPEVDRVYAGTIAAAPYNANRGKDSKFLNWDDVLPMPKHRSASAEEDFEGFGELPPAEREKAWAAMSDEQRQRFLAAEQRNVQAYMHQVTGGKIINAPTKPGAHQAEN